MNKFKNILFVLVVVAFISQLLIMDTKESKTNHKPMVSLSTFSLYDIAKHISGDTFELVMIMPFGVDAHSFEPTPKLMAKIHDSLLVVYSGAGLEPWTDGFDFKNKPIDMSKHVILKQLDVNNHHEHSNKSGVSTDPHYWLDIGNMIKATNLIADELIKILPMNKGLYIKNRDLYIAMLKQLDKDYKKKLSTCTKNTIVVNHNAFSYLANRYGFNIEALSGLSPEAEPSPKNMIRLIEDVKEHNLSIVFFESFVSDRAIKSIAKEAHVKADVLQPLGNITADEANQNLSFEDIMRQNLTKFSKALNCQ